MTLEKYRQKRRFDKTTEPSGKKAVIDDTYVFVVQKHHAQNLHYDLRLEKDNVLKSWAVPKGPSMNPADKRLAVMVEDHPLEYADFSGMIPTGEYGAGKVEIWDRGKVIFVNDDLAGGHLTFILQGKRLSGEFALVRLKNAKEKNAWLLIKADDAAKASGIGQTKTAPMPKNIKPMLATLVGEPPDKAGWVFEIKWDGFRAIAEIDKDINLYSRYGNSFIQRFPETIEGLKKFGHRAVLDGEIVAIDNSGKSQFQLLQDYAKSGEGKLIYYVFDILWLDGEDLRDLPLAERKKILKEALPEIDNVKYSDHVAEHGKEFFLAAAKKGVEGIIAKNSQSQYRSTRTKDWLKIKNINEQEAIICGFTQPRGSRKHFGALILGAYEGNKLVYIGHSGSGFDEESLAILFKKMTPLITDKSPFDIEPKTNEPATWIRPELVAQIKFAEWTNEGIMRQPIFLGLREDKIAKEVQREGFHER